MPNQVIRPAMEVTAGRSLAGTRCGVRGATLTVDEPVEDAAGAAADTHVGKRREERAEDEGWEGETSLSHLGEDLGGVAGEREAVCGDVSGSSIEGGSTSTYRGHESSCTGRWTPQTTQTSRGRR